MLRKLSKEVSDCYARAEDCAGRADQASAEDMRQDYLRLQQSWLNLAHSYEFVERLLDFSKEYDRRQRAAANRLSQAFDQGTKH